MSALSMPAVPYMNFVKTEDKPEKLSLVAKIVIIYLCSYIFEGALRFGLNKVHLASLLYLRDLLPVFAVIAMVAAWMGDRYRPSALLITLLIIAFHFFIGFFYIGRLFQQLFGLKILMPMLLGLSVGTIGLVTDRQVRLMATIMILVLVAGICANYFIPFPWEGADFDTIFGARTQSRSWTSGGTRRLAGLSRASYDAASILLCGAVVVAAAYRGVWFRGALLLIAAVGIVLTTSKGAIIAILALIGMLILSSGGRRLGILRFWVIFCLSITILAPISAFIFEVHVRELTSKLAWSLSSYVDRMEYAWPKALEILRSHGSLILGRGIGGVGASQLYGEGRLYMPADNIFVYWTLACGMLGWVYGGIVILRLLLWDGISLTQRLLVYGFFVCLLTYGVTANLMEQPVITFGLGYVIATLFKRSISSQATGPVL